MLPPLTAIDAVPRSAIAMAMRAAMKRAHASAGSADTSMIMSRTYPSYAAHMIVEGVVAEQPVVRLGLGELRPATFSVLDRDPIRS